MPKPKTVEWKTVSVCVTPEEYAAVLRAVAASGLSRSQWGRKPLVRAARREAAKAGK